MMLHFVRSTLVGSVLAALACGQTVGPLQDAEALALMDKADRLVYSPKAAGLADLQYKMGLSQLPGLSLFVQWMVSGEKGQEPLAQAEVLVADDAPEQTRHVATAAKSALVANALIYIDMVVGKETRAAYVGDEVTKDGARRVKVLAKSPETLQKFKESIITFDEKGLPVALDSLVGEARLKVNVTYRARGEQFVIERMETVDSQGASTLTMEYQTIEGFEFPKAIRVQRAETVRSVTFSEVHVNRGLKAEQFRSVPK